MLLPSTSTNNNKKIEQECAMVKIKQPKIACLGRRQAFNSNMHHMCYIIKQICFIFFCLSCCVVCFFSIVVVVLFVLRFKYMRMMIGHVWPCKQQKNRLTIFAYMHIVNSTMPGQAMSYTLLGIYMHAWMMA